MKFSPNVTLSQAAFASRRIWSGHRTSTRIAIALFSFLSVATFASAETLTGTVKNGTTNKPAGGDDVVLLSLSQGMEEAGRTKTDAKGSFSFKFDDAGSPHLVRAIHQGVTYHRMAPPGTTSVEVEVYDVAKKIDALSVTADVMYVQTGNGQLGMLRKFAINNASSPPRTQMNDRNFEFRLPDGAQVDSGLAKTAGGQQVKSDPVPQPEKNRYAFIFPLRPGQTEFQVFFHMPYSGHASIDTRLLYPAQHLVVILPKSMEFTASPNTAFQSMQDPNQPDAVAEVVSNVQAGQPLGFKISGTGEFTEAGGGPETGGQAQKGGTTPGRDSRPGGGLGPPIDAPDPLEKYRWYILGGFAAVLAAGAIYVVGRSKTAPVPDFAPSDMEAVDVPPASKPGSPARSALLLEALKEELFQLEVEHKQGRISQQEYQKAKAALDQTLERALKRGSKVKSSSVSR